MKRTAERRRDFFLPKKLPMNPAIAPPMIHPISALDTVNPRREFAAISDNPRGMTKYQLRALTVPEMTAVS